MLQSAFELEASAADVALLRGHFNAGFGGDELPCFCGFLAIDQNLTGHDESLSFLAGVGETAVHDDAVQALLCTPGFHDFL